MFQQLVIENQKVEGMFSEPVELYIKREDLLHPEVSGNKFRKLKYNIAEALASNASKVLTFGGAYSNHIAATAAACRIAGLEAIGVIRGEEIIEKYLENPTLRKAAKDGMSFDFVTRADYRRKEEQAFIEELKVKFGDFYLVPEGGTNRLAIQGTREILTAADSDFDFVCTAVGTGGTIAGIIESAQPHQVVVGFPALKGEFLEKDICKFVTRDNWKLIHAYTFGGYGKFTKELLAFIQHFKQTTGILLDPVYTGKMLYGIIEEIKKGSFPAGAKILAIHTGGLQGWNNHFISK